MRYILLAAALLAGAGGYTAYWFQAAGAIEPGIAEWADERRAEGFEVAYSDVAVRGFPFRLVVEVRAPALGRPRAEAPWRWQGQAVAAVAQPWNLRHVILSFDGRHVVDYLSKGVRQSVAASAETPLVSVVLDRAGRIERFAVDLKGLEVTASAWREELRAARLQLHGRRNSGEDETRPAGSNGVALQAEGVTLPPEVSGPLGPELALIRLDATLFGALPELPLGQALAAWRDDGGTVEVRQLDVAWGPLDLEAKGTFSLDEEMRPLGAATTRLKGYAETMDALQAAGWISDRRTMVAKAALALLAREEADGKVVRAPLTAQQGRLYVGPLPLLRLAPLARPPLKKSR